MSFTTETAEHPIADPTTQWRERLDDFERQQEGYRQVQATYLKMQQALREYQQLLREQQDGHGQVRLDFEAQRMQLHIEKAGRQQRQEERRWRGYGHS